MSPLLFESDEGKVGGGREDSSLEVRVYDM